MDFWVGFWIGTLVHSAVCCGLAYKLAKVKGHDEVEWAWYGFLFGLFGLLGAVGLPDHHGVQRNEDGGGKRSGTDPNPDPSQGELHPNLIFAMFIFVLGAFMAVFAFFR